MKKKTKRVAALSLTLSLVLTACGQKQETTTNKDEKKVATKQILNIVETGGNFYS